MVARETTRLEEPAMSVSFWVKSGHLHCSRPYVVKIAGPVRGVRKVAMYDFHVLLGIEAHPVQEHSSQRDSRSRQRDSRWRFASLTDAEKFARQFGGSLVTGR
jgi:hypothetical protein